MWGERRGGCKALPSGPTWLFTQKRHSPAARAPSPKTPHSRDQTPEWPAGPQPARAPLQWALAPQSWLWLIQQVEDIPHAPLMPLSASASPSGGLHALRTLPLGPKAPSRHPGSLALLVLQPRVLCAHRGGGARGTVTWPQEDQNPEGHPLPCTRLWAQQGAPSHRERQRRG